MPASKRDQNTETSQLSETAETGSPRTPATDTPELSPRRTLLVQIATQLASSQLSALRTQQNKLVLLDDRLYDSLFSAALRRADRLIASPVEDNSLIYAEQLFPPTTDLVSESLIGETFSRWKWPRLQSRDSLLKLMADVSKWFEGYLEKLESAIPADEKSTILQEERFLEALFSYCEHSAGIPRSGPWPSKLDALAKSITSFVMESARSQNGQSMTIRRHISERALISVFFGGRIPTARDKKGKQKDYRPWGLFRYLRLVGTPDPSAKRLLQRLCVPRSSLSPDFEPYAEVENGNDLNHALAPLDKIAEKQLFRSDGKRHTR